MERGGEQSLVLILQIYGDKSVISVKPPRLSFYPFHLVSLNFAEEIRKNLITEGSTIVAFLPTTNEIFNTENTEVIAQDAF